MPECQVACHMWQTLVVVVRLSRIITCANAGVNIAKVAKVHGGLGGKRPDLRRASLSRECAGEVSGWCANALALRFGGADNGFANERRRARVY